MGNELQDQQKYRPSKGILSLYSMYTESNSAIIMSKDNKFCKTTKEQLNLLFQSFSPYPQYIWSRQIYLLFIKNFKQQFNIVWEVNRQEFYHLLLINCGEKIQQIAKYQDQFYKKMGKIQQYEEQLGAEGIKVINSSILQDQGYFPQCKKLVHQHQIISNYIKLNQNNHPRNNSKLQIEQHIENSTVIIPQTVFVDRLSNQLRKEINQFINFYKCFSNTLQQIINSSSLISCPMKHFQFSFNQKMLRKKIKHSISNDSINSSFFSKKNPKLTSSKKQAFQYRKKRQFNNNLLLLELSRFTQAYSIFIWRYLRLQKIQKSHIGALITQGTVYSIVLKSVWALTGWIGERGYEWEEEKLIEYFEMTNLQMKSGLVVPLSAFRVMESLENQTCPQKYLKKIVIFYREISTKSSNADGLLDYVEKSICQLVHRKKHGGIFRMKNIIQKVVKMDETNGQICYAWTTWNIVLEMLKSKIYQNYLHQQ